MYALADDSVAAIVLTGAGRAFIAGADVSNLVVRVRPEPARLPDRHGQQQQTHRRCH